MPANILNNYVNDTTEKNQQIGYFRFRSNKPIINRAKTYKPVDRASNITTSILAKPDSFQLRVNITSPTRANTGVNTYKKNNEMLGSARKKIQRAANLYLQTGTKQFRESSLLSRNSNSQSPLNTLVNQVNSFINQGIREYQGIKSNTRNIKSSFQTGSDFFLQIGQSYTNRNVSISRNWNTRTNNTPTVLNSTLIKNAITQYQLNNENTQRNNFLSSAANLYLKTGMNRLQKTSLLQNL